MFHSAERKNKSGFTPPPYLLKQSDAGFTLLEVLVALFILMVGVSGAFVLTQRTIVSASILSNQLIASYLAQEGLELTRNIRDENILVFHKTGSGDWRDNIHLDGGGTPLYCVAGCIIDYNDAILTQDVGPPEVLRNDGIYYSYDAGDDSIFTRTITVTSLDTEYIVVSVAVAWTERGENRSVTAEERLYNWITP